MTHTLPAQSLWSVILKMTLPMMVHLHKCRFIHLTSTIFSYFHIVYRQIIKAVLTIVLPSHFSCFFWGEGGVSRKVIRKLIYTDYLLCSIWSKVLLLCVSSQSSYILLVWDNDLTQRLGWLWCRNCKCASQQIWSADFREGFVGCWASILAGRPVTITNVSYLTHNQNVMTSTVTFVTCYICVDQCFLWKRRFALKRFSDL